MLRLWIITGIRQNLLNRCCKWWRGQKQGTGMQKRIRCTHQCFKEGSTCCRSWLSSHSMRDSKIWSETWRSSQLWLTRIRRRCRRHTSSREWCESSRNRYPPSVRQRHTHLCQRHRPTTGSSRTSLWQRLRNTAGQRRPLRCRSLHETHRKRGNWRCQRRHQR